jgi:hypothetical protein
MNKVYPLVYRITCPGFSHSQGGLVINNGNRLVALEWSGDVHFDEA